MSLNKNGIIGTVAVHGVVIIIILLLGFSTPLPLPAEQGILINFGNSNTGRGRTEPRQSEKQEEIQQEKVTTPSQPATKTEAKEKILTQDVEDAPAIKTPEPKKTTTKKVSPSPEKKPEVKEKPVEKPVEKPREVNRKALYGGQNKSGINDASEGVSGNNGNQGSPTGSPDSPDHSLGLSSGNGISFSLEGRNPLLLQKPEFNYQKEGKVVVEITVDNQGNVVNANPGVKGSTTLDSYLLAAAKKAALQSKFDRSSNAPAYQKGTITYYFRLQ